MTTVDTSRPPSRRVSTTRRDLLRLRTTLLVATALALAGSLAVFLGVARTADAAAGRSVPAVLAVHDAQQALRSAHAAAVRNLSDGGLVLGEPGVEYQRQIAGAGQYLTLVAENNAAGDAGTRDIQTVEALLVTYTGLIGQADARYRDAGLRALGAAALRDAASLLDDILELLDALRHKQLAVLDAQVETGWTNWFTALAWLLPLVALGVLLLVAQRYLARRFRRVVNLPLLLATVATVAMVAMTSLSLRSGAQLDAVREDLQVVGTSRQEQLHEARVEAAGQLAAEVREQCPRACDTALAAIDAEARPVPAASPAPAADPDEKARADADAEVDVAARADSAADSRSVEFVLPLLALGIAALVLAGLQPRLAEYGYRST
ncbi:hypothetical protein GA0070616_4431 [Micromonospora nigra]|uniref:Uncharacterized protein n=1 Tax=Micromonospora nigra TaxID=145857 RepID=A0A1C6SRN9_9ACTN|nr:hypothetical protein [Micromonospora nigra]SCL32304.1 hypothetical protein GA0070616_4431 [Micromonospora nigra]